MEYFKHVYDKNGSKSPNKTECLKISSKYIDNLDRIKYDIIDNQGILNLWNGKPIVTIY